MGGLPSDDALLRVECVSGVAFRHRGDRSEDLRAPVCMETCAIWFARLGSSVALIFDRGIDSFRSSASVEHIFEIFITSHRICNFTVFEGLIKFYPCLNKFLIFF